jgi:hypothetical protein
MTPRQHDATMVNFRLWPSRLRDARLADVFNQGPSARWAPVGNSINGKICVTVAARAFHTK